MKTEDVIGSVLANEATCRVLVEKLIERGVRFSVDPNELSHEDLIEAVIAIYSELRRAEALLDGKGE